MSEQLGRITPEMGEQEALGLILDELIDSARPEIVAKAIRFCAIPHWFDEDILDCLLGEEHDPLEPTGAILAKLAKLAFVSPRHNHGYVYLKTVRDLLLPNWRENAELFQNFQEKSGKVADYYEDMLQVDGPSEEQRAEWEREKMYHLLVADEGRGIGLFINLLERAGQHYQLSTFDLLLGLAGEQVTDLSTSNRLWIRFFEGKRALLSGDWGKALKIWETLAGERDQVSVDLEKMLAAHLSFLYKDNGKWDKAVKRFQYSLKILKRAGDKRGMATTFNNLGFLYKDKDLWDDADKCFRCSLEILEEMGDKSGMAATYNYLGLLYKDREKWKDADKYFQLGLTNFEETDDEHGMVTILNNLGFLYKDRKNWEEADKNFQRALKILKKMRDEQGVAATYNNLGFLYTDKKEWGEAIRDFKHALKILKKMHDEPRIADTFNYLGFLYRDKEEWDKANKNFQDALEILKNMGDNRGVASVFNNLGVLYKRKGECEKAAYYFLRSLKIVEKVGDEMNAATTMYELALLYKDMEEYHEAIELLEKVVNICDRVGHPDLKVRGSRETLAMVKAMAMSNESASDQ
jgi:tetratricopeptide (TPR) repeat protein